MTVTGTAGCGWTAVSNSGFITVTGGSSGSGNGTVSYSLAANSSTSGRSGTITIAGQTFTVNQAGATCSYGVSSNAASAVAAGESGTVSVTTTTGCTWTAVSNASFITVTGGANGSGNGTVSYTVAANSSASPRSGTITIAGQTFTVNQAAATPPPTLTAHPQSQTIAFGDTPAPLTVAANGSGTLSYQWYRGVSGTISAPIGGATASSYSPPALTSTTRYWVRVSGGGGTSDSNTATITVAFTDDPLANGLIRVVHINELRTRIDALRVRYGLGAYDYQDQTLEAGTTPIQAQHIIDLRQALHAAYVAAGATAPTYTDDPLVVGVIVRAAHIAEIRTVVIALE